MVDPLDYNCIFFWYTTSKNLRLTCHNKFVEKQWNCKWFVQKFLSRKQEIEKELFGKILENGQGTNLDYLLLEPQEN